jgi:hypothetical protein
MIFKLHKKHKLDIIAHSLTASGIVIWHGIPEKIIQDLNAAGYKIKKSKKLKQVLQTLDIVEPTTIDDIYP